MIQRHKNLQLACSKGMAGPRSVFRQASKAQSRTLSTFAARTAPQAPSSSSDFNLSSPLRLSKPLVGSYRPLTGTRQFSISTPVRILGINSVVRAWKRAQYVTKLRKSRNQAPKLPGSRIVQTLYKRGKQIVEAGRRRILRTDLVKQSRVRWKEQYRVFRKEVRKANAAEIKARRNAAKEVTAKAQAEVTMVKRAAGRAVSATPSALPPLPTVQTVQPTAESTPRPKRTSKTKGITRPITPRQAYRARLVRERKEAEATGTTSTIDSAVSSAGRVTSRLTLRKPGRRSTNASRTKPQPKIALMSPRSGLDNEPSQTSAADEPSIKILSNKRSWTPQSRRVGLIALKKGMSVMWDEMGLRVPVTVLQIQDNQVTANILSKRRPGLAPYRAVQVGAKNMASHKAHIGMRGHFRRAGVPCKQFVHEFPVSEDAHLPLGMKLSAIHFVPGQYVDVQATSMGKGFQGVMKRWGFSGGTASHGNSLAHRTPGSTSQHQDPGRVWPGKKMPGRMGGKTRSLQNLYVMRVDTRLNLIFVKGNVPGPDDGRTPVYISDAKKRLQSEALRKQLKTGGKGDWVAVDPSGKPLAPAKNAKEEAKDENPLGLGRGITGLPFPAGSVSMAKLYPPILLAPSTRVTSPWPAEGA